MKENIHPKYEEVTVHCACGNEFVTRSTRPEIRLTLCNECHPFFTGKQKFVDTAGRIEKFQKRFNIGEGTATASIVQTKKKVSKKQAQSAAIQEEKRLKAARRLPAKKGAEQGAASAAAPAEDAAPAAEETSSEA